MMTARPAQSVLIEGYASLFGVEDLAGDVVRAGAFTRSLARSADVPMLLQHQGGAPAGRWSVLREDGLGLFVRGLLVDETPSGRAAISLCLAGQLDGLSIGFLAPGLVAPRRPRPRSAGNRIAGSISGRLADAAERAVSRAERVSSGQIDGCLT